jgi:hypothetical protein
MDLVDRYVQSVRSLLPKAQQDDIAEELEGAIRGRIEDRESELKRKLKDPEIEAILHEFGHPIAAAGRYAPQRHLIGPELYPYWWIGAKISVGVAVVISIVRFLAAVVTSTPAQAPHAFGDATSSLWNVSFFLIGVITVIAAVAEHNKVKPFANWRARDLGNFNLGTAWPDMSDSTWNGPWNWNWGRRRRSPAVIRTGAAVGVFFSLIGVGLWALLPLYIDRLPSAFDPRWWLNLWGVALDAKYQLIFWALLLAQAIAQTGVHLAEFTRPGDLRVRAVPSILAHGLTVTVGALGLRETGLLYRPFPGSAELHGMGVLELIERGVQLALVMMVVIGAACLVLNLWRLAVGGRARPGGI